MAGRFDSEVNSSRSRSGNSRAETASMKIYARPPERSWDDDHRCSLIIWPGAKFLYFLFSVGPLISSLYR